MSKAIKYLYVLAMLALCGCSDSTEVLSNNGTTYITYCGDMWVECINKACPNGFDIVMKPTPLSTGIVKCKL